MSRAFVNEDRGLEELPVPARAVLPTGVPNWVTPRGFRLLREELENLNNDFRGEEDKARQALLRRMQAELEFRLASAQIIDLSSRPPDEIRFGATVRLRPQDTGADWEVKLVGADEADPSLDLLSIHSPLAKALLGKKPGQRVVQRTHEGKEIATEVLDVRYDRSE
ncbi:MAG: transcription elongation factor GreAB [Verrucomicrobiaceae bacterium]|nr:transcription elongation factor GreAB [Verrucomicrobiaceae bacterium]